MSASSLRKGRRVASPIVSPSVYKVRMDMREPTYLILTSLADGAKHGYGVMQEVAEISGGRVQLRAGTLYAALDRLVGEGLIEVDSEEVVEGRLRRYYVLTDGGSAALGEEALRLQANAKVALKRLRVREVGA